MGTEYFAGLLGISIWVNGTWGKCKAMVFIAMHLEGHTVETGSCCLSVRLGQKFQSSIADRIAWI